MTTTTGKHDADGRTGTGRVALISGASRGIGLATARELLDHGWRVSVGTCQPVAALDA